MIPLFWLYETFGMLNKTTLFWVYECLPQNPNEMLLIQCIMSYPIVNQKWESSMQRSQLNADWRLTLTSQLCSEGFSLLQEFLCHVGWTCLCCIVPSLLLGLKQFWGRKTGQRRVRTRTNPNPRNTLKANDASSRKGSHWGFHSGRHVNSCYVCIHESLGQLSALTVKYIFYLLFWSSLRVSLHQVLLHSRAVVTSPWIRWSNCGNISFGICLYLEKQDLELK